MASAALPGRSLAHAYGASYRTRPPTQRLVPVRASTAFDLKPDVAPGLGFGATKQQLAQHMLTLEKVLPTLSCSQLAHTVSSIAFTYKAAHLSCNAEYTSEQQQAGSMAHDIIEYITTELPDQSWLLTFREAVGQQILQHPASLSAKAIGAASTVAVATGSADRAAVNDLCSRSRSICEPEHLSKILAALAGLPIMVVQPLPIGFGTPRWYRPLAAADPAAWEAWLADVAAVYSALLQQQMDRAVRRPADASSEEAQGVDMELLGQAQQQQQPLQEQLADFIISLACAMRWANVNVNDDRLQTKAFKRKVLDALLEQQLQDEQQPELLSSWEQGQEEQLQQQVALSTAPEQQLPMPMAGSIAHRVTYTMLLLLLPPPRPLLAAFFDATAPQLSELFSIPQLMGLVRGLLFLGAAPPEPWLHALVDVVRFRAQELPAKDVQGFVEGFRFFGTKATKAGYLRDATAQLEEFTLC